MERLIPVVPNGHSVSVYNFLEWQEMVVCMGQRNGTIASKQALGVWCLDKINRTSMNRKNTSRDNSTPPPS